MPVVRFPCWNRSCISAHPRSSQTPRYLTSCSIACSLKAAGMRFSVVTISYNQAKFLRRAIDSVLNQSGVDLEYIVVDPGSSDDSRAIIDSYGDRIGHRVYEPDQGPADGLNKGFAHATGKDRKSDV